MSDVLSRQGKRLGSTTQVVSKKPATDACKGCAYAGERTSEVANGNRISGVECDRFNRKVSPRPTCACREDKKSVAAAPPKKKRGR